MVPKGLLLLLFPPNILEMAVVAVALDDVDG
jgi:hypothetical protein